jgi:nitrite reductase/ring-hydroxylating ferredoxin subunit/uncharacterized membrane protein
MLIPFPLALFTATVLFDIAAVLFNKPAFALTAYYIQIVGVAFALVAAVPGIIDFIYTVPPDSSAKKRAGKHGLLNSIAVVIFLIVWFYKRSEFPSVFIFISAELIGFILISIAGWMGGTLVYRNHIGVYNRYGNSGKWNEEYFDSIEKPQLVATVNELKENQMKLLHIKDKRIVLAKTENKFVAFDDRCTHKGGSLAGGSIMCGTVQCPWHGSQFNVFNGNVTAGPANEKINTYSVQEKDGNVYLVL